MRLAWHSDSARQPLRSFIQTAAASWRVCRNDTCAIFANGDSLVVRVEEGGPRLVLPMSWRTCGAARRPRNGADAALGDSAVRTPPRQHKRKRSSSTVASLVRLRHSEASIYRHTRAAARPHRRRSDRSGASPGRGIRPTGPHRTADPVWRPASASAEEEYVSLAVACAVGDGRRIGPWQGNGPRQRAARLRTFPVP